MVSSNAKTLPRDPYPPAAVVDQGYLRWVRFFLGVWVVPTVVGWIAINFQIVNAWKLHEPDRGRPAGTQGIAPPYRE